MPSGLGLFAAALLLTIVNSISAEPKKESRERKITRVSFTAPSYERDMATLPVQVELDEGCKKFVGFSVIITEVHPIRPNENVRAIIRPYAGPHPTEHGTRAEVTFHVKRDAKYRIELEMVYEDAKGQLIHHMEKEEIRGER
jgi:hypothetical protein